MAWRVDTLRPHTEHRWRLCAWSQAAGTSPCKLPARRASMWACMVVAEAQPRARRGSAQGQPATGQKTRPATCATPSTSILAAAPSSAEAAARRGERGARSPPTGVPGEGAIRNGREAPPRPDSAGRETPCTA